MNTVDNYVINNILSFLNEGENFIIYETCKYFKNFIDSHDYISKKCPSSEQIVSRFKMLYWAESHPSFKYSKKHIEHAVKYDNIKIVRYLINEGCPKSKKCFNEAVINLSYSMVILLNKYDFSKSYDAFIIATELDSLKMVKFLDKYDFPHDIRFANTCAGLGNLKILKWLIKNNYIWDTCTFHHASKSGDIRIMKLLYEISCNDISKPWWDMRTFHIAVKYNNLEIMEFLIDIFVIIILCITKVE